MKYLFLIVMMSATFVASAGAGGEQPGKKGIGVSCKRDDDCASNYCKPNKAHLPGYIGTCQRP
jgi:hypothetical protein